MTKPLIRILCLLSVASLAIGVRATSGGAAPPEVPPVPTVAAPAQADAFPARWFGRWRGTVLSHSPGGSSTFTMELSVAPTEDPDRFAWTIVYDGEAGRQVRPYELVRRDTASGRWAIDEKNGIVLDARRLGDGLYAQFELGGHRVTVSEVLRDVGGPDERIEVEMITTLDTDARRTGGKEGVPEVSTNAPTSVQRATLRR